MLKGKAPRMFQNLTEMKMYSLHYVKVTLNFMWLQVSKVEPVEQVDSNSMSGDLMEASLRSDDEETGQSNPNAPMSESAASHHKMVKEKWCTHQHQRNKPYDYPRLSSFKHLISLLSLIFIIHCSHERALIRLNSTQNKK